MAIQLLAKLSEKFHVNVTLVELFADPTVEGLARLISIKLSGDELDSCLVRFHDKVNKPPLFMIHPSGGSVHWYTDLAKSIGDDQPVYGIQAKGINNVDEIDRTVSEMAARYVDAIKSRQKSGPYYISSWSMGVVIAFEVARQLEQNGDEIGMLAMIDQGPIIPNDIADDDTDFLLNMFMGRLKTSRRKLKKIPYDEQLAVVLKRAQKIGLLQSDLSIEQFRNYVIMLKAQMEAWRDYDYQTYQGDVLIVKAAEQLPTASPRNDLGWSEYVTGSTTVFTIPGNHNSILWMPDVKALVQHLTDYMHASSKRVDVS
jgi:thioesterase domain-containing protein